MIIMSWETCCEYLDADDNCLLHNKPCEDVDECNFEEDVE